MSAPAHQENFVDVHPLAQDLVDCIQNGLGDRLHDGRHDFLNIDRLSVNLDHTRRDRFLNGAVGKLKAMLLKETHADFFDCVQSSNLNRPQPGVINLPTRENDRDIGCASTDVNDSNGFIKVYPNLALVIHCIVNPSRQPFREDLMGNDLRRF